MTVDAARRSYRPSLFVTARTLLAMLATTVALAALATVTVGCAPPREPGAPTPAPTLAAGPPVSEAARRS